MHHSYKVFTVFGLLVLLGGMISGCAPKPGPIETGTEVVTTVQPVEPALVITDALDRSVTFDKRPERIVVAGKATALLVNTLYMFPEARDLIVAIENRTQSPDKFMPLVDPTYADKLVIEKNAGPEAITPTHPDVVILKTSMKASLGDPLETIGVKVVYLDLETPDAFYHDLQTIGFLFGNGQRAEELIRYYQERVSQVSGTLKDLKSEDRVSVLLLQHSVEENVVSFEVPPATYLQTLMTEIAGGTPVWKDTNVGDGWQTVTLDQIATWNPWEIVVINYSGGAEDALEAIKADPTWQQLDAVRQGNLKAFPMDYLSWDQPDPRWILGLQWLAHAIHADYFPAYDPEQSTLDFYGTVYGLDEATITSTIFPLMKGTLGTD